MSVLLKRAFNYLDDNCETFRNFRKKCGVVRIKGVFTVECRDKDGNLKWREIAPNGTTTGGLNHMLGVEFWTTGKSTTWYLSLINSPGTFNILDTMGGHGGWTENTSYSSANRPTWGTGSPSGGSITNGSAVSFTMTAGATIKGFFCVNQNTKGGTTGDLWATAAFATGDQVVVATDVINVTYTVTLS